MIVAGGRARARWRGRWTRHGGGAPPFAPSSIAGLFLDLDPSVGFHLTSGNVDTLNDQSGTGNNVAQATGGKQPLWVASDAAYGGQPVLQFAGAQNLDRATLIASQAQPVTLYVVGNAGAASAQVFVDNVSGSDFALYSNAGKASMAASSVLGSSAPVTSPCVMCGVANTTSSAIYVTSAGTAVATGNAGAVPMATLRLGNNAPLSAPLTGRIARVLGYAGAHSPAQRAYVMGGLGARYALSVAA